MLDNMMSAAILNADYKNKLNNLQLKHPVVACSIKSLRFKTDKPTSS